MKNVVKLDNFYFPEEMKQTIEAFVNRYNHHRHQLSLSNLPSTDSTLVKCKKYWKRMEKLKKKLLLKGAKITFKKNLIFN
jgi:hypothetical protein